MRRLYLRSAEGIKACMIKRLVSAIALLFATSLAVAGIAPCEGPTGIAYDKASDRIFSGCNNTSVVVDPNTGKIVSLHHELNLAAPDSESNQAGAKFQSLRLRLWRFRRGPARKHYTRPFDRALSAGAGLCMVAGRQPQFLGSHRRGTPKSSLSVGARIPG